MKKTGQAYFVPLPRRIEDLRVPHDYEKEQRYEIVKTVRLSQIEYENFITDMVADRAFIEDNAGNCSAGEIMKCLLVQSRKGTDGILVIPRDRCFVEYAAYWTGESE